MAHSSAVVVVVVVEVCIYIWWARSIVRSQFN